MATTGSRFRRGASARDERVGEMLDDSSDDDQPLGSDMREAVPQKRSIRESSARSSSSSESREGGAIVVPRATVTEEKEQEKIKEAQKKQDKGEELKPKPKKKGFGSLSRSRTSRATTSTKRSTGKKWYSDSDEEEILPSKKGKEEQKELVSDEDSDLDAYVAGSVMEPSAKKNQDEDGAETTPKPQKSATPVSEHSSSESPSTRHSAPENAASSRPTEVQTGGEIPTIIINRRTDRLKHSASGSDYSGSPRLAVARTDDVLSPGLRKVPGAFPGRAGSGVLLEGWLRQKQRRGIKGMKKWNSRYFVLYARSNEVRYYADVVQSAWGPIPLGEIGAISLRLIQRIGKRSHPKYKGCRFDITCRNTWGTHYAGDYVSSDEENGSGNTTNSNNEKGGASTPAKQDKGGTPRSSRVYSLVADSPQVTVAWVNMLDSLLVRSANSPRPDVSSPADNSGAGSATSRRTKKSRAVARQQSSALDTESMVLLGPDESVPKAIIYAINFIFDSTPGIETEKFYEVEPDAAKLRAALKFLNQFASEPSERKPTKAELEEVLDAITAGAVVKLWLKQLEQPVVPFSMYQDFQKLAREAQTAPFDLRRNLRALLDALPKKNLTMLACLLFHLNDVNVYSSKNGMDAARLAHHFSSFIIRAPSSAPDAEASAICSLVEEMITNVDSFIDEKEAQLLEDHRL